MKPPHLAGTDHIPPDKDSKGWKRIILRGCGGNTYNTIDGPEFCCDHDYTWDCSDCPVGIEASETQYKQWANAHQGPPAPFYLRTVHNSIDTELTDFVFDIEANMNWLF